MSPTSTFLLLGLIIIAGCADDPQVTETPSETREANWFKNQAAERGVLFDHVSGFRGRFYLPEITAGGVAVVDVDGDGDLDLYFVQSGSLYEDAEPLANELYLNDGEGRFTPAGERGLEDTAYGMGVAVGDYDNDGDVDLYVTNVGPNRLFRNDGNGFFVEVGADAGVADAGWGTGAAFVDLDNDGWLDLFHANYVIWSPTIELDCFVSGTPTYCPPQNYNAPAPDHVYRNNGDGTFTDVSTTAGIRTAFGNGFGVLTGDFDGNGLNDVFVANDMTVNQLWLNQGDFTFAEDGMLRGVAVDSNGIAKAGMGVAGGDVDRDGDVDLLVVNLEGQTDSLFRNEGTFFSDATGALGLVQASRQYTRWGVTFGDFDNDGWLDLFEANGRVDPGPSPTDDPLAEPNLLYAGGVDGFRRLALDRSLVHNSRGMGVGDLDDDGGIDLVIANRDGPAYVMMNEADRGAWIRFRVLTAGRDAIGAEITLILDGEDGGTTRRGWVQPDGSYLAANDMRVHFGMGAETAAVAAVLVRWPDGSTERFDGPFALRATHTLTQNADI